MATGQARAAGGTGAGGAGTGGTLWVRGGTVVTETAVFPADIFIADGKIAAVGDAATLQGLAGTGVPVLDASGAHILPGAVDVHVHFRDPGLTHKEDFLTGSAAAACGGVTTVLDMPNTLPPVSTADIFAEKRRILEGRSYVDYGLYGVITQGNAGELPGMAEAGAIAWKLFLGPTTGDIAAPELGELLELFPRLRAFGLPVAVHAEDRSVIEVAQRRAASAKPGSYADLLASRPRFGELLATETAARLAEASGVHVHIAHVALREALEVIARYKARGVPLTAETCPPYLFLSQEDAPRFGAEFKIFPPVRERADGEALWEGLSAGTLDLVATDHAPHLPGEKAAAPDIWSAPAGAPGVETLLPLMLDAALAGRLSLPRLVQLVAANPARTFGLYPAKGSLQPGADGDLAIVDLAGEATIDRERLHSKAKSSLFHGRKLKGRVEAVVLRGHVVARGGTLVDAAPRGRFLRPLK